MLTENETIMSAERRLQWLTQLVERDDVSTADKLRAIDYMNKMRGDYVLKDGAEQDAEVIINIALVDE